MTYKHGMYQSQVYKAWQGIKERCFRENLHNFSDYGGRGIKMYSDWVDSFESFYEYIGDPPEPNMSIERLNLNKHYFPENIVWATQAIQNRNRRMFKINKSGVTGVSVKQRNGISYYTAIWRGLDSKEYRKCFSGRRYGDELAMFIATEYRRQQINFLNILGAGYSLSHGEP